MAIKFISGDLFINRMNAAAFAHGCNCIGSMGAGIAVEFKARYPDMFVEYRRRCKAHSREFNPGDVFLWKSDDQPWVFNLATQENTWLQRAKYEWVEQCHTAMRALADSEGIESIAIPRIGTGFGGLSWKKLRPIVERIFADWSGTLVVYEAFVAGT
jgi:O-acetyl-ADP-ribose deacetylase (regulator of RNase III)